MRSKALVNIFVMSILLKAVMEEARWKSFPKGWGQYREGSVSSKLLPDLIQCGNPEEHGLRGSGAPGGCF